MPALRPRLRRSARLQTISQNINVPCRKDNRKQMDPPTRGRGRRGRGGGGGNIQDSSPATISWHNVPMRTNKLVNFLVEHPPDCAILFATESKKSSNYHADLGRASGKDKGEIYSVIAKVIFHDDATYGSWYATNPIKFRDSVANRIASLRTKFRDIRAEFESTGAGIVPIDSETSDNLHRKIEKEFPWYNDLYRIWGSNPSFSAKTSSSKPGADHAGDLFALTRPAGGSWNPPSGTHPQLNIIIPNPAIGSAGSPQLDYTVRPSGPSTSRAGDNTHVQQTDYARPPPSVGGSSADSPVQTPYVPLPRSGPVTPLEPNHSPQYAQGASGAGSSPQRGFSQAPASNCAGSTTSSPLHFGHTPLPPSSRSFGHEDYSPAPLGSDYDPPFDDGPLAHGMGDLCMDDTDEVHRDEENVYNLDSPPRSKKARGKKRQLPSSPTPSPPKAPPPRTSNHDSRSSFKSHVNHVIMRESASSPTSSSKASLQRSNPSSPRQASPTSQTSLSERPSSRESVKKRLRTEVQEQVEMLNDDLESVHSEKLTLYQLKNERLMVKLNANRQDKEHHFIREERAHERADAALVHQRLQESKDQEIRLREADAKALELERQVMLLRIEYAKINKP
ncbi:hypothetical protein EV424DRAFT_1543181 [Suillus variegatus]|nr:hypothetical protein EV424DRAFT_1543181 [Suillus variegatus]